MSCWSPSLGAGHVERVKEARSQRQPLLLFLALQDHSRRGKRSIGGVVGWGGSNGKIGKFSLNYWNKSSLGSGRCSKMTPVLGVPFWSNWWLSAGSSWPQFSWPGSGSPSGGHHKYPSFSVLRGLSSTLPAEIPLVLWQTPFWSECLFEWLQVNILVMDMNFMSVPQDVSTSGPVLEGNTLLSRCSLYPVSTSSFRQHLSGMGQASIHSVCQMQERIFPFIGLGVREIHSSHAPHSPWVG